jgi:hypothetical protein
VFTFPDRLVSQYDLDTKTTEEYQMNVLRRLAPGALSGRGAARDADPLLKQDYRSKARDSAGRLPPFGEGAVAARSVRPKMWNKWTGAYDRKLRSQATNSEPVPTTGFEIEGCLTRDELQAFNKLTGPHKDYFTSQEGITALQRAKNEGRTIDFESFKKIPAALLKADERFPSPLFRLASKRRASEIGVNIDSDALTNALKCKLFDIEQKGDQGRNPVHVAAIDGNVKALEQFAKCEEVNTAGSKERAFNAVAEDNHTPLECVFVLTPEDAVNTAKALLDAGADLKPRKNADGPIQLAVKSFRPDLVAFATSQSLERGILYDKDGKGRTPHRVRRDALKDARRRGDPSYNAIKALLAKYKEASQRRRQPPAACERTDEWTVAALES